MQLFSPMYVHVTIPCLRTQFVLTVEELDFGLIKTVHAGKLGSLEGGMKP
jgi:hypothetical protein